METPQHNPSEVPATILAPELTTENMQPIQKLGKSIESFEGMDKSANNPFALRWSPFEDGQRNYIGKGTFATFDTYERGWEAGIHQLMIVAKGISPAYNYQARQKFGLANCSQLTLAQFFEIYSPSSDQNDPAHYAHVVSEETGISEDATMGSLLA